MLFSHDGIHDSQTHLATSSFFYEQLQGEISLAQRSHSPIALIKIVFENPESEQVRAFDILHFSHELGLLTRREDCIGRLEVLSRHAVEARGNQRNRVMAAAGKAEISMMIPVVFLILPISILFALWPSLTNLNMFAS